MQGNSLMQGNDVTADWLARIAQARAQSTCLGIRGGGSKNFFGEPTHVDTV
ncbi:MAG: hypothetical protein ACJATP_002761, partial [Candidatus Azotimanducaceae bacterium]